MKRNVLIIVVILLIILLMVVAIKLSSNDEKKQYEKSEYIEFGYEEPNILSVMFYVTEGWKYKITQDGSVYYCTKKHGGEIANNSEEYEKYENEFNEIFVKKIDKEILQEIEEYINEKSIETREPRGNNIYMRIMENGEWKTVYDNIDYLKQLIGE